MSPFAQPERWLLVRSLFLSLCFVTSCAAPGTRELGPQGLLPPPAACLLPAGCGCGGGPNPSGVQVMTLKQFINRPSPLSSPIYAMNPGGYCDGVVSGWKCVLGSIPCRVHGRACGIESGKTYIHKRLFHSSPLSPLLFISMTTRAARTRYLCSPCLSALLSALKLRSGPSSTASLAARPRRRRPPAGSSLPLHAPLLPPPRATTPSPMAAAVPLPAAVGDTFLLACHTTATSAFARAPPSAPKRAPLCLCFSCGPFNVHSADSHPL